MKKIILIALILLFPIKSFGGDFYIGKMFFGDTKEIDQTGIDRDVMSAVLVMHSIISVARIYNSKDVTNLLDGIRFGISNDAIVCGICGSF